MRRPWPRDERRGDGHLKRLGAVAIAAALLSATGGARAQDVHHVEVRNNEFRPALVEVHPGDTVRWTLTEGIHTVTSDVDGQFASGSIDQPGTTFEVTMPETDAWVYYHCSLHGAPGDPPGEDRGIGMFGIIKVGNPPTPSGQLEVRPVPSDEWPTLTAALEGMKDTNRFRIELEPGTYTIERNGQRLLLNGSSLGLGLPGQPLDPSFSVEIVGTGDDPSDVVIGGGVLVGALRGLSLRHLSIDGAPDQGILFDSGATRWQVEDVLIAGAPRYGVLVRGGASKGGITATSIAGAMIAGIGIEDCESCDVFVDRVDVTDSLQGLSALNAGGLVVTRSTFTGNSVGVAVKTSPGEETPARGAHIWGNTIVDNTNRDIEPPALSDRLDLPVGAGVWLAGSWFSTVEENLITGASFPVVITGPAYLNRVHGNTVGGAIEADLAWDGLGASACFGDNIGDSGQEPTSMPPAIQTLYPCEVPVTAGVPYPLVDARVLAWGTDALVE